MRQLKSLQFRKLCRVGESMDEWMGRLCVAVAECNYRELDRQLVEQFIHGLNDKVMLDEIIRELTAKTNDEHVTSERVLAWAKRTEVQRVQATILNDMTESHQFDKIKMAQKAKRYPNETNDEHDRSMMPLQILQWDPCAKTVSSIWKDVCQMQKDGSFQEGVPEQERLSSA